MTNYVLVSGAGKNGPSKNGPGKNGPAEKMVLSLMVCAVIRVRLTSYYLRDIRHYVVRTELLYSC